MSGPEGARAAPAGPLAGRELLLFALWLGAWSGAAELAGRYLRKRFEDAYLFAGVDLVWMIPLANTVPVLVMAALLALASRGRLPRRACLVALISTAAFTTLYFLVPRIHWLAALVLALGVAVPVSALMDRHFPAARRLARWTLAALVAVIAVSVAAVAVVRMVAERRAVTGTFSFPAGRPNVVLVVIDTERALSMSLYGHDRPTTPTLERLAGEAAVFDFAVSTAPWTLPSHASLFTGRWPHEAVQGWLSPMNDRWPTLAEVLTSRGWLSAAFSANREFVTREFGVDRGFTRFDDFPRSAGMLLDAGALVRAAATKIRAAFGNHERLARRSAGEINARFLSWQRRYGGRPFFAFLNYYEPHEPYLPHEPFRSRLAVPERDLQRARTLMRWSPPEQVPAGLVAAEQLAYDATIAESDAAVGALLDSLRGRGLLDHTVVIITSDHGEEFGEHGVYFHGHSLYLPTLRIPLVIRFPAAVPAGSRVTHPVSLRDVPATIVDLLGLPAGQLGGTSLARWWHPDAARRPVTDTILAEVDTLYRVPAWIPSGRGDMRSALTARHHYIVNGDGRKELYDIVADPMEQRDLASDSSFAPIMRALHARLVAEGALAN